MTELVAYYESEAGHYMPIITVERADGELEFRDLTREDIMKIPEPKNSDNSSGWLHKRGQGVRATWSKRFMIVRGQFLFYSHSPRSDRPVGVVPLENCEIVVPPNGDKNFPSKGFFKSHDGFDFDIAHPVRRRFQLYASTEQDRAMWVKVLSEHTGRLNGMPGRDTHSVIKDRPSHRNSVLHNIEDVNGNISVTTTRLVSDNGDTSTRRLSVASPQAAPPSSQDHTIQASMAADFFAPPPPPAAATGTSLFGPGSAGTSAILQQHTEESANNQFTYVPTLSSLSRSNPTPFNNINDAIAFSRTKDEEAKQEAEAERANLERDLMGKLRLQQEGKRREAEARANNQSKSRLDAARALEMRNPMSLAEMFRAIMFFVNEKLSENPSEDSHLQFPHLKGGWVDGMMVSVYQRYCKASGFMSLEEFVAFMEDFAVLQTHCPHDENDEPLPEFHAQLDPVRLLTTIPRNLGFSREMESQLDAGGVPDDFKLNFAQFYQILLRITHLVYPEIYEHNPALAFDKILQESVIPLYAWSQGHSKRGSSDPLVREERIALLLITYAPNLWRVFQMYCQNYQAKVPEDHLPYPIAAKRSEEVLFGPPFVELHNSKLSALTVKTDSEPKIVGASPKSLVPARSKAKLGAHNNAKVVAAAKTANQAKTPGGASLGEAISSMRQEMEDKDNRDLAYIMTEAACVRFARDYGLVPNLMSKRELKELVSELNRHKMVNMNKPSTSPAPPTAYFQKTTSMLRRELSNLNLEKSDVDYHMRFGSSDASPKKPFVAPGMASLKNPSPPRPSGRAGSPAPTTPKDKFSGLGFSEFVELVAAIAVRGMNTPHFAALFPSSFAKVLAILNVWGVADLRRAEEVQAVRTEVFEG